MTSPYWPTPSKSPNTPVATDDGLLTAPYSGDTIRTFTGRYLDSHIIPQIQFPFRTARAYLCGIDTARNRLYMIVGSALFAYDLQRFFTRLESGEPLVKETFLGTNFQRDANPEKFLMFDAMFYAEKEPQWKWNVVDGQDRLFGFDFDDRGYVYLAYGPYGWGIVKDNGSSLRFVYQRVTGVGPGDVQPNRVISIKSGSGGYYAIVCSDSATNVFAMVNPDSPVRLPDIGLVVHAFAHAGNRIATVGADGKLRVHTNEGIIDGLAVSTFDPPVGAYYSVDTDGTNFYATAHNTGADEVLTILTPNGAGYIPTSISLRKYGQPATVRHGAGYLAVFGFEAFDPGSDSTSNGNIRLYKVNGTSISPIPIRVGSAAPAGSTDQYFSLYYTNASHSMPGYTNPSGVAIDGAGNPPGDVRLVVVGKKLYMPVAIGGLGEVYEMALPLDGQVVAPPVVTPPTTSTDPPVHPPSPPQTPMEPVPVPSIAAVQAFLTQATQAISSAQAVLSGTVAPTFPPIQPPAQPPSTPPIIIPQPPVTPPVTPPAPPTQPLPELPNGLKLGDPCDRSVILPDGYVCDKGRIVRR